MRHETNEFVPCLPLYRNYVTWILSYIVDVLKFQAASQY